MEDSGFISEEDNRLPELQMMRMLLNKQPVLVSVKEALTKRGSELSSNLELTLQQYQELYLLKKSSKVVPQEVLNQLADLGCSETKAYINLENDLETLKTAREETTQILKRRSSKKNERPSRLRVVQKEKSKTSSFEKIQKVYNTIGALPKNTLFYELFRIRSKIGSLIQQQDRIEKKLMDFWMFWPKGIFLNCEINNSETEKASNSFKDHLHLYRKANFQCDTIERHFFLIENLLKASVLRVGKKKASFSIFEKIYDALAQEQEFMESTLMRRMFQKKQLCDNLKNFEAKIKAGDIVSFGMLYDLLVEFKEKCPAIDLRGTDDYLSSICSKVQPVLGKRKEGLSFNQIKKQISQLKDLTFEFKENKEIENKLKRVVKFSEKIKELGKNIKYGFLNIMQEYFDLGIKISEVEQMIKTYESEKAKLLDLRGLLLAKITWGQASKLLKSLRLLEYSDSRDVMASVSISAIKKLRVSLTNYTKKRGMFKGESMEDTLGTLSIEFRVEFLSREGVRASDIDNLKEDFQGIYPSHLEWGHKGDLQIDPTIYEECFNFFKKLTAKTEMCLQCSSLTQELPTGSFLEDFTGINSMSDGQIPELLKDLSVEIRQNINKNREFGISRFEALLETRNIYRKVKEKNPSSCKMIEVYLQRISHLFKKLRHDKLRSICRLIKCFRFKPQVVIRLATRSENSLKKLEEKLRSEKKFRLLFLKGSSFYCRPEKLLGDRRSGKNGAENQSQMEYALDQVKEWVGVELELNVKLGEAFGSSKIFDIKFLSSHVASKFKNPRKLQFNSCISSMEFEEMVVRYHNSESTYIDLGKLGTSKSRSIIRSLITEDVIMVARLEQATLFLFAKVQFPQLKSLSKVSKELSSRNELYCLLVSKRIKDYQQGGSSSLRFTKTVQGTESIKRPSTYLRKRKNLQNERVKDRIDEMAMQDITNVSNFHSKNDGGDVNYHNSSKLEKKKKGIPIKSSLLLNQLNTSTMNHPISLEKKVKTKIVQRLGEMPEPQLPPKREPRVKNYTLDEVKPAFDEFASDYELNEQDYGEIEMEFLNFYRMFDAVNPDFVYEIGEVEDEHQNPGEGAGDMQDMFCGNMDAQMAQQGLPTNNCFLENEQDAVFGDSGLGMPNFNFGDDANSFNEQLYEKNLFEGELFDHADALTTTADDLALIPIASDNTNNNTNIQTLKSNNQESTSPTGLLTENNIINSQAVFKDKTNIIGVSGASGAFGVVENIVSQGMNLEQQKGDKTGYFGAFKPLNSTKENFKSVQMKAGTVDENLGDLKA